VSEQSPGYRHIWTPLRIGSITVKNRIVMTAMTSNYAEDHILSERHIAFYRERAKGGAGLMITEQQGAYPYTKGSFHMGCSAWDKRSIPQYAKLADAVHEHGARMFAQLAGWGVHDKGAMIMDEWHPLWAASRVPSILHHETPMVVGQPEIDQMVEGFGQSALHVQIAGLDGVELHGAHSYVLGQFLSPAYNKRTDRYGGSVRRRCQLILDIIEAIRRRVGRDFTVGLRLSLDEFLGPAGITQEQGEEQLEIFASTGRFDFFNISGGGYHTVHKAAPPMSVPHGFMIPFGKRAKELVGERARVFIVGRIVDLGMAESVLADGAADMVGMMRALLADPFLLAKAREGREREITKCAGVYECGNRLFQNREVACMLNPAAGHERQWGEGTLKPAANGAAKQIVVVGGGPAGMKTAAVAARRGHKVALLEKEPELGGHINLIKRLPTRGEWQTAIDNLIGEMEAVGVEVSLNVTATRESLLERKPDAVICATGAHYDTTGFSPYRPDRDFIPGYQQSNVIDLATAVRRALADPGSLGRKIVILDETAAYLPFGLAEVLAANGKAEVEVITPHMFAAEDVFRTSEMPFLFPRLKEAGVRITAQHFIERIDGDRLEVYDIWGGSPRMITGVDALVMAVGRVPNDALFDEIKDSFKEVHRVGDVLAPRRPAEVIHEAEKLAREI
jgi:2,4-dienoyl-CoA reductase-like NADH-dependent reductase (Old Yellow Enzyme family)